MQQSFVFLTVSFWILVAPQFLIGRDLQSTPDVLPNQAAPASTLRLEIQQLPHGTELLTLFASPRKHESPESKAEFPLMSILRDSLGSPESEVHRLRQIWLYPDSQPSIGQRIASAVPFFYFGFPRENVSHDRVPSPLLDLAEPTRSLWRGLLVAGIQRTLLDQQGLYIRSSTRTLRHNAGSHQKRQLVRAATILSLCESEPSGNRAPGLSSRSLRQATAKLMLAERSLGSLVREFDLDRAYVTGTQKLEEMRGRNWELLRQRAEAEGLYFDPIGVADKATHALIWVARPDLLTNKGRPYDSRFLNIASPWNDEGLLNWNKYSESWNIEEQHRRVSSGDPGARAVEMIPLAIYGLENPRIPTLLIDYRNAANPKRRELSRRILDDATRNVLGLSPFGNVPYFVGRSALGFALNRWGKDVNQPSRLRSFSQLELALAMDSSVSSDLHEQTRKKLARVSVNPLDNEATKAEARQQYLNLLARLQQNEQAGQALAGQRDAEARSLLHSRSEQTLLGMARVLTFGIYRHREQMSAELEDKLVQRRRIDYHLQILREATQEARQTDVVWDLQPLRESLEILSRTNGPTEKKVSTAIAQLLRRTHSEELRLLCFKSLQRIQSDRRGKDDELYQAASVSKSPGSAVR